MPEKSQQMLADEMVSISQAAYQELLNRLGQYQNLYGALPEASMLEMANKSMLYGPASAQLKLKAQSDDNVYGTISGAKNDVATMSVPDTKAMTKATHASEAILASLAARDRDLLTASLEGGDFVSVGSEAIRHYGFKRVKRAR